MRTPKPNNFSLFFGILRLIKDLFIVIVVLYL